MGDFSLCKCGVNSGSGTQECYVFKDDLALYMQGKIWLRNKGMLHNKSLFCSFIYISSIVSANAGCDHNIQAHILTAFYLHRHNI